MTNEAGANEAGANEAALFGRAPLGQPGLSWRGDGALGGLAPLPGGTAGGAAGRALGPLGLITAPLWSRSVSFGIDLVGLFAVFILVVITMNVLEIIPLPEGGVGGAVDPMQPLSAELYAGAFLAQGVYYWVWSSLGWSPGKRLLRLRIVNAQGEAPGPLRGLVRALVSLVSQIWAIGYLIALTDPAHRTFHDRVSRTWVVLADQPSDIERAEERR